MTRNFALLILAIALAAPAAAQTTDLALRDAVARAIEKNRDVVVERESATLAEAGIERSQAPTTRRFAPTCGIAISRSR